MCCALTEEHLDYSNPVAWRSSINPLRHESRCVGVKVQLGDSPDCQRVAGRVSGGVAQHQPLKQLSESTQVFSRVRFFTDMICHPPCLDLAGRNIDSKLGYDMEQSILIRDTEVKATDILDMISRGLSYYQILLSDSRLTLADIMVTAKLAKELIDNFVTPEHTIIVDSSIEIIATGGRIINVSKLREEYPQAFERWTKAEEQQLAQLFHSGKHLNEIAKIHQRKRGAIRSRLKKLGLVNADE